jgi:3-hydroxybutyryl-CoA dehydratase
MMLLRPAPIAYPPLTRTDFVRYAGASGDFNPLHHDRDYAEAAGLADVMGHGMLSAGLLASALTTWFGEGSVVDYAVRFQSPVWPGDALVASCTRITPLGADRAEMELTLARGADDVVLTGRAVVRLEAGSVANEGDAMTEKRL